MKHQIGGLDGRVVTCLIFMSDCRTVEVGIPLKIGDRDLSLQAEANN